MGGGWTIGKPGSILVNRRAALRVKRFVDGIAEPQMACARRNMVSTGPSPDACSSEDMMLSFVPEGILIDFYGTISDGDRAAVEDTCRHVVEACKLLLSPQEFAIRWGERYFATVGASNHAAFRTLYECEVISLRNTLEDYGVDRDPAPFLVRLQNYWRDPPLHVDAVEFLRRNDLPICCVSNADAEPLMAAIEKYGLRFDAVVSSETVRCYKPEPKIFEHALHKLGMKSDRVIHIGDSLHSDIAGAKNAGVIPVWLCRKGRIHDIGDIHPEYKISSLNGFLSA